MSGGNFLNTVFVCITSSAVKLMR